MSEILFLLHEENTKTDSHNEGNIWEIPWETSVNSCFTPQYGPNFQSFLKGIGAIQKNTSLISSL
jgi:hypothetical protein